MIARRRRLASHLLPLTLLVGYGVALAAAALGAALPASDDHPGQLARLHHVLRAGPAPWAWHDGWWAGYPELQFYPPGYFYLGALLHGVGLPPGAAYQALAWVTLLAPGLAVFAVLARLAGGGWPALPGAVVALTLSAGLASGVEGGVHLGMLPARLGWALLPLTLLALGRWIERGGGPPWPAAPLLAAVVLVHPAHLPAAVLLVLLGAWLGAGPRARRIAGAAAALVLAAGLTAFWTLPLLARLAYTRPLAWGRLAVAEAITTRPLLPALALLALLGTFHFGVRRCGGRAEAVVAWWPWAAALAVATARALEPLGFRWLPADRLADSGWLALVLAAGVPLGRWVGAVPDRAPAAAAGPPAPAGAARRAVAARPPARALAALAAVVVLGLPAGTLALWPRTADWPSYAATTRGLRLDDLWAALREAPAGRILFLRSAVPLVYGTEWWRPHTHVTALAPVETGRSIVNGTFTHPSPVAALLYRGSPAPGPITRLVEQLDGRSLLGRPLESLDPATFGAVAERLGVAAVVALDEDAPRLGFLEASPAFERWRTVGPFLLWRRSRPIAIPVEVAPGRWRLALDGPPGSWAPARVMDYPLWRAARGGEPLPTRRGPAWDLEVRLNAAAGPVELQYGPGRAERAGVAVSALAAVAWLAAISAGPARRRWRARRPGGRRPGTTPTHDP